MNTSNSNESCAPLPVLGAKTTQIQPQWNSIPPGLRERAQWVLADADKAPRQINGGYAKVNDPTTWTDFGTACRAAEAKGWHVGYVLTADDPFTCIDLDIKPETPQERVEEFTAVVDYFNSYTERSRSGKGFHIWVEGNVPQGYKKDGIEVYSDKHFMICTGNVVRPKPIKNQQKILDTYVGNWQKHYQSQSEADLAFVMRMFQMSGLAREKTNRIDYIRRTVNAAAGNLEADAAALEHGRVCAERLLANWRQNSGLTLLNLGDVEPEAIDWLWLGFIPRGFITLVVGETGAGKSTGIADIVARITTGRPWPGEDQMNSILRRKPAPVLWLGSEDPTTQVTVPRLDACGADRHLVSIIKSEFSLQDDLSGMRKVLTRARDKGEPFELLVIDPVTSYLPGKKHRNVNANDAGQIRSILEPWLRLAEEFNIAIICVTHLAKDTTRSVLHRVLHSSAFSALCRSLVAFIELKNEGIFAKAMFQIKTNLPEHPGGAWRFNTLKVQTGFDKKRNKPIVATKPVWEELDSALTPENAIGIGKERGPVSEYGMKFSMFLKAQFIATPLTEGRLVADIKRKAIADGAASERWWNEHSNEYLDKKNFGGVWYCRPLNKTP